MAKVNFSKQYKITAKGILNIDNDVVSIENTDTGELISLAELFADFADKDIALGITYGEEL